MTVTALDSARGHKFLVWELTIVVLLGTSLSMIVDGALTSLALLGINSAPKSRVSSALKSQERN